MKYTLNQLVELENPYVVFKRVSVLEENKEIVQQLTYNQKVGLASQIIAECPEEKLSIFHETILPFWLAQRGWDSFFTTLILQCDFKKSVLQLIDEKNPAPHEWLLQPVSNLTNEFAIQVFYEPLHAKNPLQTTRFVFVEQVIEYMNLARYLLQGKELALAERLAISTPEKDRQQLTQNIKCLPTLSLHGHDAFKLRAMIDSYLQGKEPENCLGITILDSYHKFPKLFGYLLKDQKPKHLKSAESISAIEQAIENFLEHREAVAQLKKEDENNDADVKAEDMALSYFGRGSKTGMRFFKQAGCKEQKDLSLQQLTY